MTLENKNKAKSLIIERINNFKPEFETIDEVLEEIVADLWEIFEDDLTFNIKRN